jgi:hypothetical protein
MTSFCRQGDLVDEAVAVGDGAVMVVVEVDQSELVPTSCWERDSRSRLVEMSSRRDAAGRRCHATHGLVEVESVRLKDE